jgi:hypothetical protein
VVSRRQLGASQADHKHFILTNKDMMARNDSVQRVETEIQPRENGLPDCRFVPAQV